MADKGLIQENGDRIARMLNATLATCHNGLAQEMSQPLRDGLIRVGDSRWQQMMTLGIVKAIGSYLYICLKASQSEHEHSDIDIIREEADKWAMEIEAGIMEQIHHAFDGYELQLQEEKNEQRP